MRSTSPKIDRCLEWDLSPSIQCNVPVFWNVGSPQIHLQEAHNTELTCSLSLPRRIPSRPRWVTMLVDRDWSIKLFNLQNIYMLWIDLGNGSNIDVWHVPTYTLTPWDKHNCHIKNMSSSRFFCYFFFLE